MDLMLNKYRIIYVALIILYFFIVHFLTDEVCAYFETVPGYSCYTGWYNLYIIHLLIVVFISLLIPIHNKKPSTLILNFLFIFCFIPNLIYFPKQILGNDLDILLYVVYMSLSFLILILFSNYNMRIKLIGVKSYITDTTIIFLALLFISLIVKDHGLIFSPPNITDVYDVRESFKEGSSLLGGYAVILGGYVIAPLIILLAIIYKHRIMVYLGLPLSFLLIYIIFSSSGIKSIAFSSIVIVIFYFLFRKISKIGVGLVFFLNIFIVINYLIYKFIWEENIIFLHWLRRLIVAPGSTASKFLEYFYILGNSKDGHAPLVISNYYFATSGSANTGFFVEGVGRFGLYGLIINTFLLGLCLMLLDFLSKHINKNLLVCLLIMIAYALCNTSFLTVLFSYGLILIIVLSYLLTSYKFNDRN